MEVSFPDASCSKTIPVSLIPCAKMVVRAVRNIHDAQNY